MILNLVDGGNEMEDTNRQEVRETFRERSQRENRNKRDGGTGRLVVLLILVVIVSIATGILYKRYAPSKKVMPLTDFFHAKEGEILLMLHDQVLEETAFSEDKEIYLPYDVVENQINQRLYFDSTENILSCATESDLIRASVGQNYYMKNKNQVKTNYTVIKMQGEQVYIALDFVKAFSNVTFDVYKNPNRIMIEAGWGNTYSYYQVNRATKLRYKPGIKCDVLASLEESDVLRIVNDGTEELESYAKVMTKDGVTGYVLKKYLSEPYDEVMKNNYKGDVFSHNLSDKTINMTWHQVTNSAANEGMLNLISNTKGLNVISPTWYSISSNSGTISSLASETYVQRAHNNGLKVWALCDDFRAASGEISLAQVLGNTTNRDKLVNGLLSQAIQYGLDGINIDFENVKKETAAAYLEFLRELSIKCRANNIVLSVDSYVPSEYTEHYDREEQGKVVDYVVVMAYDEHYSGSEESGSVASIGFVKDAVNNITEVVDPKQVIIAMPFYSRLWKEETTDDGVKVSATAYGMSQAEYVLSSHNVTPEWDKTTGQNYGEFEADGYTYKMWLEDNKSIEEKLKVIFEKKKKGKVAGVSTWKLGLEKSSVWNTIQKYTN
ncbi:MAG: glycosyl hydrolase family 18 [Lachnospiraceae bacterium]|nr:glycosyl hydrolase family 18 [Lachnospiraceae bacterium]